MKPEHTPTASLSPEAFRIRERNLQAALARLEGNYAQLEQTQSQLRAIIDASPDALLLLSSDGRPVKVNRCFTTFFGLDDAQVLSQRPDQLIALLKKLFESSGALDRSPIWSLTDHEQIFRESLVQVHPSQRVFDLFSLPVTHIDHNYLGRLYVWHDVTHEHEVDRMKSALSSMVTHELRTPLTCIKGFVDLLVGEETADPLTEEQREALTIIQQETHRMLSLTNDLLDLSHLESGTFEWFQEPLHLNDLVLRLIPSFQRIWEADRQTFTLHLPVHAPIALGDAERVTQILANLLSNAHKYTPAGGSIDLSIESVGAMVSIIVADTGIGLSTEEQTRLFTRFYRAHNPMMKSVSGTGLGLTITRMLVEMQGGEISVTSEPGHGSMFRFTLPAFLPSLQEEGMG
jgi:signal transduction histidine kinase